MFCHISPLGAQQLPLIRISVENTTSHVQTRAVQRFADKLAEQLSGKYEVQFYPAATLFRDADLFRALAQGKVEIGVPGTWQFDRYVPEVGLFLLPSLYGRDASVAYGLMESEVGRQIISAIELGVDVKVLGRWIDLGHTHIFSTEGAISRRSDFADKRIRVAGGIGNTLRIAAMGALPSTVPWPDFPAALKRDQVDGVLTSYETIASARLWEYGIDTVYEDRQYFAQYVPIAASQFWDRIPQDVQQVIINTWDELVDAARRDAAVAQVQSRATLIRNGASITLVNEQHRALTRQQLVMQEKEIVAQMGISDNLYTVFQQFIHQVESPIEGNGLE
jgi:C4-dicarboxylate-binding protein DctP